MTVVMKTLVPARPVGKELLQSSSIPFLDRNNPDAYSTCFQEDFRPCYSKKVKPFPPPLAAELDCKDMRHTTEYLTEAMMSYQRHPLPKITNNPERIVNQTNIKMPIDPREDAFLTRESQEFRPYPFQPPIIAKRPTTAIKMMQQVEKLPESTSQANFMPYHVDPVVKATVKHLEEGFPTIKGHRRCHSFDTNYNNAFQGAWGRAAQTVNKHSSSVPLGDPMKMVERETTYAALFRPPSTCRPTPVVKEHIILNLGRFPQNSWSYTSREDFCHKLGEPVVLIKKNRNFSSLPEGDTDMKENKERMSVTTNRASFSHVNHTQRPICLPGLDMITKSHIQLSSPSLSGLYYTTTAKEYHSRKDRLRARPDIQHPSNILSGPEHGLNLSTNMENYPPWKTCKRTPCPSLHTSNLRFPLGPLHFSTINSEVYTAKPLILQPPVRSHLFTDLVLK